MRTVVLSSGQLGVSMRTDGNKRKIEEDGGGPRKITAKISGIELGNIIIPNSVCLYIDPYRGERNVELLLFKDVKSAEAAFKKLDQFWADCESGRFGKAIITLDDKKNVTDINVSYYQ
ncbi:MAG: hypothetical protein ACOX0Z_03375 [Candidatus Nanosyncoccaceae bacterium]|jgi:hypothetical protein